MTKQHQGALLTVKEVAQQLGVSTKTVSRLIAEEGLTVMWVGGQRRFSREQIDAYLRHSMRKGSRGRTGAPARRKGRA